MPLRSASFVASVALCCAALLTSLACRASPDGPGERLTTRASEPSATAVRLELPVVRQDDMYDCGLASISSLCGYWGVVLPDEDRVALARLANTKSGLSGGDLRAALERAGFEVFVFSGALDQGPVGVYAQIDAGRPVLVMLANEALERHYELVLGYDEALGTVALLDPMKGETSLATTSFEAEWRRCARFTLLATPASMEPATTAHLRRDEGPSTPERRERPQSPVRVDDATEKERTP